MFIRIAISFLLLALSLTANSSPIRYYFEGEIQVDYGVGMPKPALFRDGELVRGWVDMDWDQVRESDDPNSNSYVGGLFYKLFFGDDGGRVVSGGGHDMLYISVDNFEGLPNSFYDNYPVPPTTNILNWIDDTFFQFDSTGGEFYLFYVMDWVNNGYDVKGSFNFTDEFIIVPEPSPAIILLLGLALISIKSRFKRG